MGLRAEVAFRDGEVFGGNGEEREIVMTEMDATGYTPRKRAGRSLW